MFFFRGKMSADDLENKVQQAIGRVSYFYWIKIEDRIPKRSVLNLAE